MFRKTNIFYPVIRTRTCACQVEKYVSFSKYFGYVLSGWPSAILFMQKLTFTENTLARTPTFPSCSLIYLENNAWLFTVLENKKNYRVIFTLFFSDMFMLVILMKKRCKFECSSINLINLISLSTCDFLVGTNH